MDTSPAIPISDMPLQLCQNSCQNFHYKLFPGFCKISPKTINWGIRSNCPYPINLEKLSKSTSYPELAKSKNVVLVDVNGPVFQAFTDAYFRNDLTKQISITGFFHLLWWCHNLLIKDTDIVHQ